MTRIIYFVRIEKYFDKIHSVGSIACRIFIHFLSGFSKIKVDCIGKHCIVKYLGSLCKELMAWSIIISQDIISKREAVLRDVAATFHKTSSEKRRQSSLKPTKRYKIAIVLELCPKVHYNNGRMLVASLSFAHILRRGMRDSL